MSFLLGISAIIAITYVIAPAYLNIRLGFPWWFRLKQLDRKSGWLIRLYNDDYVWIACKAAAMVYFVACMIVIHHIK